MKIQFKDIIAWELCGNWEWVGQYLAYTKNGRVGYEDATASKTNQTVLLRYLDPDLHQVNRYVAWDTPMELKKIKEGE